MILFRQNFSSNFICFWKTSVRRLQRFALTELWKEYSDHFKRKWTLVNESIAPRWREKRLKLDWETRLRAFYFQRRLQIFSSQIKWETKLILFDTVCFARTRIEYCFLTPKWVHNFGDNNGKKVDTQNVEFWLRP